MAIENGHDSRLMASLRHGERVDYVFGKNWCDKAFNSKGEYIRFNINMPRSLPKRSNYLDYSLDSPNTEIGIYQATLHGEMIADHNIHFQHIFSSPAFRCIQTCDAFLKGAKINIPISIEPGFSDGLFLQKTVPKFMSVNELTNAGFNINKEYTPFMSIEELSSRNEDNLQSYYERNTYCLNGILKKTKNQVGNILIVSHSGNIDFTLRKVLNLQFLNMEQIEILINHVPFSAMQFFKESKDKKINHEEEIRKWEVGDNIIPDFKHGDRIAFVWRDFISRGEELLKK